MKASIISLIMSKTKNSYRYTFLALLFSISQAAYSQSIEILDVNDTLSEEDLSFLAAVAETQMAFHKHHFEFTEEKITIPIRAFTSERKYDSYKRRPRNTLRRDYPNLNLTDEITVHRDSSYLGYLSHHIQHKITRSKFEDVPYWIDEGLSEFYERAQIRRGKVTVRMSTTMEKRLDALMELEEFPNLTRAVLNMKKADWESLDDNEAYEDVVEAISWALVYFLMSNAENQDILSIFMEELMNGDSENSLGVIDYYYPEGLDKFEKDFDDFLKEMPSRQYL